MSLKVYWNLASQPARAIKALVEAGGVQCECVHLDLIAGEQKKPEYLAINPAGTLPFITVDGKCMIESASILRYLAKKYDSLNKFYSTDLEQCQDIDMMLDFHGTSLRPAFLKNIFPRYMNVKANPGQNPPPEIGAEGRAQIKEQIRIGIPKVCDTLEKQLGENDYICGKDITIADFQLYCEVLDCHYVGFSMAKWPKVTAWMARCRQSKGLKEVHDEWDKMLPGLQKMFFSDKNFDPAARENVDKILNYWYDGIPDKQKGGD